MGHVKEFMVKKAGKVAATEMAEKVARAAIDHIHFAEQKSITKTREHQLIVRSDSRLLKRGFVVCNETGLIKYRIVNNHLLSNRPSANLYDMDKHEVGSVRKNRRRFASTKSSYSLILNKAKAGAIQDKSVFKVKFIVNLNGWYVKGNPWTSRYSVYNASKFKIMDICSASIGNDEHSEGVYVMNYDNSEDEILGILMLATIDLITVAPNKETLKAELGSM